MFTDVLKKIQEWDTITIYPHSSPDGDALGSCFGLKELLVNKYPDKKVYVVGTDCTLNEIFFPSFDVVSDDVIKESLAISLDTANLARVYDQRYTLAPYLIKIDHHPNLEPFGDICIVEDQMGATCELVSMLGQELYQEEPFPQLAARYLYAGIMTDTMGFTTSSTNAHSLQMAAYLSQFGVNHNEISYLLTAKEVPMFRFISKLREIAVFEDGFLYIVVPASIYQEFGISYADARNQVSNFAGIKGIKVWCLFTESDGSDNVRYSASLRSRGIVINDVAREFHGGGHEVAAGAKLLSDDELPAILEALRNKVR